MLTKSERFLLVLGGTCVILWVMSETGWMGGYPFDCGPGAAIELPPPDLMNRPELPDLPERRNLPESVEEFSDSEISTE